jgi:hypothetical protein
MKSTRDFFAIAVIVIGLTLPIKVVSAQGLPPGQLPELTGEWWQWALSIPASVNPNLVQPGDDTCMIGQRGPIWPISRSTSAGVRYLRSRPYSASVRRPTRCPSTATVRKTADFAITNRLSKAAENLERKAPLLAI